MTNQIKKLITIFTLASITIAFQNCADQVDMTIYKEKGPTSSTDNSSNGEDPDTTINNPGTVTNNPVTTTQEQLPVITEQTQNHTASLYSAVTLSVQATGGNLTYYWYLNGTLLASGPSATYSLTTAQTNAEATYNFVARAANTVGYDETNIQIIIQRAASQYPPTITTQPVSLIEILLSDILQSGGTSLVNNLTRSISVTATNATSYQWYFKPEAVVGQPAPEFSAIVGATNATYNVIIISNGTSPAVNPYGTYYVLVTNPNGSVNSNETVVKFEDLSFGGW